MVITPPDIVIYNGHDNRDFEITYCDKGNNDSVLYNFLLSLKSTKGRNKRLLIPYDEYNDEGMYLKSFRGMDKEPIKINAFIGSKIHIENGICEIPDNIVDYKSFLIGLEAKCEICGFVSHENIVEKKKNKDFRKKGEMLGAGPMKENIKNIIRSEIRKIIHVDNNSHPIYEGLIRTVPLGNAVALLRYWGPRQHVVSMGHNATIKLNIKIDEKTDTLVVDILWFERKTLDDFIINANNLGYFISEFGYKMNDKNDFEYIKYTKESLEEFIDKKQYLDGLTITLEAKFDIEIYPKEFPEKLYHICPQDNLKKILQIGLVPRSGSKIANHPERIYFSFSAGNALAIAKRFKEYGLEKANGYSLLEINTSEINHLRMFEDPNFKKFGVYIMVNVHPDAITVLKENIK